MASKKPYINTRITKNGSLDNFGRIKYFSVGASGLWKWMPTLPTKSITGLAVSFNAYQLSSKNKKQN